MVQAITERERERGKQSLSSHRLWNCVTNRQIAGNINEATQVCGKRGQQCAGEGVKGVWKWQLAMTAFCTQS